MSKRVLIIGYWFGAGSMGGVRLRRIARQLPATGWEPIVLMPPRDALRDAVLPEGIRTEQVAAPDLTAIYTRLQNLKRKAFDPPLDHPSKIPTSKQTRLSSEINRWLMIPDKQITWYWAALKRGRELLQKERCDCIFASLDPRTCLLLAARLSKEMGVPCVLEYRDLWTGNPYYHLRSATPIHCWAHRRLERKALRQARRVTAVCRGIANHLSRFYGDVLQNPVQLNYNFFDPDEYPTRAAMTRGQPFVISYVGALYASRTPNLFLDATRVFLDQTGLKPDEFRFRWAGGISGIDAISESLERNRLQPYLDYLGQVPHREALQLLVDSDVSMLVQAPDDNIHIPGKLFEAMGAQVPLLAISNPCETTEIIERCEAGIVCSHDRIAIAKAISDFVNLSTRSRGWTFNRAAVNKFCATEAVGKLASLLEEVRR